MDCALLTGAFEMGDPFCVPLVGLTLFMGASSALV